MNTNSGGFFASDEKKWYLTYRIRRPRGVHPDRGGEARIAQSEDPPVLALGAAGERDAERDHGQQPTQACKAEATAHLAESPRHRRPASAGVLNAAVTAVVSAVTPTVVPTVLSVLKHQNIAIAVAATV